MIVSLDLLKTSQIELPVGTIMIASSGVVSIASQGRQDAVGVPGFRRDTYLDAYVGEAWACVVGPRSEEVVVADFDACTIRVVGMLNRLDLILSDDHYDPGGMGRVAFHALPNDDVLIETEIGVAKLSRLRGLVWQRVHDDATCRVTELHTDLVWLTGENARFAYRLSDGRFQAG